MDIKVGQKWKMRNGCIAEVIEHTVGEPYPFILRGDDGSRFSITESGRESTAMETGKDLVKLIGPKPWYPDDSGEWVEVPDTQMYEPALPTGTLIKFLVRLERDRKKVTMDLTSVPADCRWANTADHPSRIVAYRVVGAQTLESTLPSAPDLLDKAAGHMRERAATYDAPGGERSMAKTVALFNLHHDTALTEAQGWHFMQILKDVRLFSAKGYHADSAEDKIAYAALMSEAKAKEGAQ